MAGWADVTRIGGQLPEVEEATWYGTPALKVRGKGFARLREDETDIVVFVDILEREALMQLEPDVFHITPHYEDYPAVLMRLAVAGDELLREQLVESWLRKAPPKLAAEHEERLLARGRGEA